MSFEADLQHFLMFAFLFWIWWFDGLFVMLNRFDNIRISI